MGLPGLRRLDHVGFTVPDLDEATRFLVDVLGCEYLYPLGPVRATTATGWPSTSTCTRARRSRENRFFRLRRPGDLRGVPLHGARPAHRAAAQQRHRRPPRRALRRRPRRRRRPPARARRDGCSASRPPARGPHEGQRWVYFLPLGHAVRAGLLPARQGVLPGQGAGRDDVTAVAPARPASQPRSPTDLRQAILGGEIGPGERVRQEDVAAAARGQPAAGTRGAADARGRGADRARGQQGRPGARGCRCTRSTSIYQMRERLEPLALTESIPQLTDADLAGWPSCRQRDRGQRRRRAGSSSWTGSSTC